ncbi:uncharacterized protein LOC126750224 [Anthonomus grandis grandis]|uniref:uncharacterized protein LOC126750224 n=1 Tax=Anthonomus grandis grandis TaxID=2921223 RepID=UPI002166099D|nr:uncharacterized protein LOC126750224 [Anthonomus grandis grandis]
MTFWYVCVLVAVSVAHAKAGCLLPPPLPPASSFLPGLFPSGLPIAPAPAACAPAPPACGPVPIQVPVKRFQQPDLNVALPVPSEIHLGKYCSCRKYGITPSLVNPPQVVDGPVETINVPEPPPPTTPAPPAPQPAPALSPAAIQALLALVPAPAPVPAPCAVPAPAPVLDCGCY